MESPDGNLSSGRARSLYAGAAAAAVYAILVAAGSRAGAVPLFRPAAGFLAASLLIARPRRFLPALGAAFAIDFACTLLRWPAQGWAAAAATALADVAEAALAAALARRGPGHGSFLDRLSSTVRFFTEVIPASAACGSALATAAWALGGGTGWGRFFATRFLADAAALAVVAPAVLAWARRDQAWPKGAASHVRFAACALLAGTAGAITYSQPDWIAHWIGRPLPYATFPFLLWAALSFGARGTATVQTGLYFLAAWMDARGQGPYQLGQRLGAGLIGPLQWFPYAAAFCTVVPAVLVRGQRRVEAALRRRESRYGKLWTSKLIGIYIADLSGRLLEANDTFLAMMGLTRAEADSGRVDLLSMASPAYRARAEANAARFREEGQIGPFEREWILKDGTRLLSLVYAARMDEPDRALGMVMDTHELDQAKRDLRLRESRYRGLLSNSILGVYVSDVQGKVLEANDAFLGMIKRSRADLEAGRIDTATMATPEYLTGAAERREQFRREGRMGPFERDWVLADGSRLTTLFFATRLEGGEALCMAFDTNELKRTKLELRAVESRFKKLFDSNIMAVAVMNEAQVFEEANATFLEMTGYTRTDLATGKINAYALRALQSKAQAEAVERLAATGRFVPQETVWARKDGSVLPVFRGVARLDESNRWLIVGLDLTELKKTQAELEAASRAKSDFLAHMSHEIRTPLNGVLGMLSLLLGTRLDAEQGGYARAARESGDHLLALLNQVLDFSKIERGHLDLEHEPFRLAAVIEGALSSVQEGARRNGLALATKIDPALPQRFAGDALRLQQVLLNLLGNAVKFSDRGEVGLSVSLAGREGDRCRLAFEVSDQGPGIAPEHLARIFEPFRQGDESLSRKAGGTGLGLAISRELVRRMGGDISVASRPGEGSRFRFEILLEALPAAEAAAPAESRQGLPGPAREAGAEGPRILVVDDHPVNLTVASALLGKLGCAVDTAADGEAALAAAAGCAYDLVFMDCQMPGMDGFEATRRWRARETGRRTPIVALTAHAVSSVRDRCLAEGMDDYLAKPFTGADLDRLLRRWIPRERSGAASTEAALRPVPGEVLLDPSRLDALEDGTAAGAEGARKLMDLFRETTRSTLERVRAGQRAGDADALARSLHRLRGSCATLGATAMARRVQELEERLESLGPAGLEGDLEGLEALFARTEAALAGRRRER